MGEAVSYTMLRSMAKAKYSEIRHSHFGLGIENYCHFTSPIRRLSDLATHRIIKKVIFEGKRAENYTSYARRAAAAATEGELRALSAERRIEDLYKVIYMSDKVGEEFCAVVNSITSFGMFVTLPNTCEGLIPISELDGVFSFDERNLTLRSRYKTYHIADRLNVRLEEANISRGKLRFSVVK
jgi:ribonuclease R